MHCVRFEMRLNQLLDERASLDSDMDLIEHARACPDCADLLTGHELLLSGVGLVDEPSAGPDLAVCVAAELARGSRYSFWRRWMWSVPAVAAGFLIALGLWRVFGMSRTVDNAPTEQGIASEPPSVPRGLVPDANDPYRFYVRTEEELKQRFRGPRPEWVDQMADGLKPVADSMSAAFHALRKTFPGRESAVRSSQYEPLAVSPTSAIG